MIRDLPPSLATRLAITAHRRLVARAPLFNSLSDLALLAVLKRLTPLIYVPSQVEPATPIQHCTTSTLLL